MRRALLALLLFVVGCAVGCAPVPAFHASPPLPLSDVVIVETIAGTRCAGSLVGEFVLTAAHCVPIQPAIVTMRDGLASLGDVVAIDSETDVAVLRTGLPPGRLSIGPAPRAGDEVTAIGHPDGARWAAMHGSVAIARRWIRETPAREHVLLDLAAIGGMSGGPVLDARGRVVGVMSFRVTGSPFSGAVHVNAIRRILRRGRRS